MAAAIEGCSRVVDVDAVEGRGEAVGVALPAHLPVGDDVESRPLLVDDGEDSGVVLRLLQPLRRDSPQLGGVTARREAIGQPGRIDQPVRLSVGTDERGR